MIHLLSVSLPWMVTVTFIATASPTKTGGLNRTMAHHYKYPCRGPIPVTIQYLGDLPTEETPENCIPALMDKLYYLQQRLSELIGKYVSEEISKKKNHFNCVLSHLHLYFWESFDKYIQIKASQEIWKVSCSYFRDLLDA